MPRTYFDTGALVKLYLVEEGSPFVQRKAMAATSMPINALQETELRNAIHAAIGRGSVSSEAGGKALEHFDTDLAEGVWDVDIPEWSSVWNRAAHLAKLHTRKILCRTLDILHVAAAETCGAELVVTGDMRQFRLCKAVGLPVSLVPPNRKK